MIQKAKSVYTYINRIWVKLREKSILEDELKHSAISKILFFSKHDNCLCQEKYSVFACHNSFLFWCFFFLQLTAITSNTFVYWLDANKEKLDIIPSKDQLKIGSGAKTIEEVICKFKVAASENTNSLSLRISEVWDIVPPMLLSLFLSLCSFLSMRLFIHAWIHAPFASFLSELSHWD